MKKWKNYNLPIFVFLILEKTNIIFWTNNSSSANHFYFLIEKNWLYILNQTLKNELFLSNSFLIESSAVDKSICVENIDKINLNRILFYTYYFYSLKAKISIFLTSNNSNLNSKNKYLSVDKIYKNANWIERETSEMYNIIYIFKNDNRKLLLDYAKNEYPLLKDYPSEGYQDVFYNFFENQVIVNKNEVVEL